LSFPGFVRSKIVCTIGPASSHPRVLDRLLEAGMDVARLNMSHGSPEEHRRVLRYLHRVGGCAVMVDLPGPKIRLGRLPTPMELGEGDQVVFAPEGRHQPGELPLTYPRLAWEVSQGGRLLLNDGAVEVEITDLDLDRGAIHGRVVSGGVVSTGKGVNAPGARLSARPPTPRDLEAIAFGVEEGCDWFAASFVRGRGDVEAVRRAIEEAGGDQPVVSKVEHAEAVFNLSEVVEASDGVMVARGDLGVEMPPWEVPLIQKRIIEACNRAGKPVIVATQMLESMVSNPLPTRAEASDVANALLDGADAVMLSAETAVGQYPVEAVRVMNNIGQVVEQRISRVEWGEPRGMPLPDVIGSLAARAVEAVEPSVILVATRSGFSALMVSKHRPRASILAFAPHIRILRRMHLYWGVKPVEVDWSDDRDTLLLRAVRRSLELGYISRGDIVEIVSGSTLTPPGQTTTLEILRVDDILDQAGA